MQTLEAVRVGGHISMIGSGEFRASVLIGKQVRLQGLSGGSRRQQRDLVRALDSTGNRLEIDREFALDEVAEAFRYQEIDGISARSALVGERWQCFVKAGGAALRGKKDSELTTVKIERSERR